ncbi:DNA polymerase epsilon catalytic subunit A [Tricharina praecox]|uniref:DNA polymerase epsilon catalytic subunit A n=1 Tax=Tricharina praecox TaxID=43433 RepID=UPI00221F42E4|nr:DNA polymerase epsilon catalytic subunit A [Tricharina praecox]KAI5855289.1 DNA polymerase epsilon catalytic subunit A [Tricharina praecox]
MASVRSRTRFVKSSKRGGGGGRGGGNSAGFERRYKTKTVTSGTLLTTEATSAEEKFERVRQGNAIDDQMGFLRYDSGPKKVGWLVNMQPTTLEVEGTSGKAGVDFYFLDGEGDSFKATVIYDPYFLIATKPGTEGEVEEWLRRKFEGLIKKTSRTTKEDLSMPNHLLGYRRTFVQLDFANVTDLLAVRKEIMPIVAKNKKNVDVMDAYAEVVSVTMAGFDFLGDDHDARNKPTVPADPNEYIVDIREYDVPYHVRVAIDKDIRVGKWYTVEAKHGVTSITCIEDRLERPDPVVLAFDIETTKLPLKFPDALIDQVMMISYMIEGQGFLITNREIVSEDISDFEYTPKPEYEGQFMIFNEPDEKAVIERFFEHIKEAKPTVIVTYNGDFFDWPFIEARASFLGIDMYQEIGFRKDTEDLYKSNYCVHMDAFSWVRRDSYLPQGSQGLKAVCVAKLGYDPDELDPELMTRYAAEKPQTLAEYSVSDAVATYYLYMKYVHPFIFSLCTIIPLNPDDVLRKGTGTLCEMLLMVQAYQKGIVLPNKHKGQPESFYEGHLLESETYVGGHVESIEAGVFRSDIPVNFVIDTTAIDKLVKELDAALKFSIVVEGGKKLEQVTNYDEVKEQIEAKLLELKVLPQRNERPSIYHLDVASMYPNIMTTNRLQPDSMIEEADCAACDFNRPGKTCDRRLPWAWRGEYLPAKRDEYNMIKRALENETFPPRYPNQPRRTWDELPQEDQAVQVKKRLQDFSKKIYHKIHESKTIEKEAIICQRENPFYVDTVKDFRDRRYHFKGQQKVWNRKTAELKGAGAAPIEVEQAKKMVILFDSLQLAHKVILNSFYGYVMRKGSRWYSMEMAGVTCLTGAHIIQLAKDLVERVGRPLELDTDGIWCILPATFPENFAFKLDGGGKLPISYPCVMLNHLVHEKFTNDQYQELVDPANYRYETHSENTIFFEVDGPYRAMILPTSKEEDKNLKKRYAVFNHDGSLAELKGFEVKRRGELKLIKIFQTQIFKFFLEGTTLQECYDAVAKVSNQWLDVLYSHGSTLADAELMDLISENRSMSKSLEEYGSQKSTSITTARRLAEFLGEQMVKDKGLACKFVISSRPRNAPVAERAIPVAIFSAEENIKRHFLRKWLKDDPGDMDPRDIIDWGYYLERLGSVIQKLITIPAALQKCRNPVPRVAHPEWLQRRINIKDDRFKQKKMTDMFVRHEGPAPAPELDMEDFGKISVTKPVVGTAKKLGKRKSRPGAQEQPGDDPFASLPDEMPSMTEDYPGWLKYQKQKWSIQKHARERRRQLFGDQPGATTAGLSGYFRQKAQNFFSKNWQVLQLKASEVPGEVKAHVLIENKIQVIKIKVPRQLYMNLKENDLPDVEIEGCMAEKVNHTLPNGHPSVHLFQLTMPEEVYVSEARKLSHLFTHPSVEGVYETQVPSVIRAVLNLGSICTFDDSQKGVLGKGLEQGFDLSALRRVESKIPYLSQNPLEYTFVYHLIAGDRQIFGFFSTSKSEAYVVVHNTKDASLPNMDKIYAEQLLARRTKEPDGAWQKSFEYQDKIHFKIISTNTKKKLQKEISTIIKNLTSDESGPTMLIVQSPKRRLLMETIPTLNEFPILPLKSEPSDSSLPPLGWQTFVAKRIVTNYLALGSWISHLMDLARYGDIPLCNLERDDPKFLIDIAYARRLQSNNVVLWWSPSPKPDHGGHEKDDVFGAMETVEMPIINNPGSYSSVCIEIDVRNLAINTILTSSLINELEGSDSVTLNPAAPTEDGQGDGANVIFADNAFATAGVMVLRDMVKAWWAEACKGNNMADIMVQHIVRWVESPDSFLYDRALHYYVQTMSKKAFLQLLTDFRRVGSNVIFANANRMLVQTTKFDVGNAYAYSQYILKAIKAKPLFHFLDLEIKEYWDYIVWYDEVNYGGKGCQEVIEAEKQSLNTVMHWQLAKFLPTTLQSVFHEWVVEFIEIMHSQKHILPDSGVELSTPRPTQLHLKKSEDDDTEKIVLGKEFQKPLRKQIAQLVRRQHESMIHPEMEVDFEFPKLPGAIKTLKNPALQLIRSLTAVFGLAKEINIEARVLRKELLGLLDIKEFSRDGVFENPSESLKFSQVICSECTMPRDLDLCKHEDFMPELDADAGQRKDKAWKCSYCGSEYDRLAFEEKMIGHLQQIITGYNTQDLKCSKCGQLKENEFEEHCKCSGPWETTVDKEALMKRLAVYKSVAEYYDFDMLLEVSTSTMGMV